MFGAIASAELLPLSMLCDDVASGECIVSGSRMLLDPSLPCNQFGSSCVPLYEFSVNSSLTIEGSLSCAQRGVFKACAIQINTTFPVHVLPKASISVRQRVDVLFAQR